MSWASAVKRTQFQGFNRPAFTTEDVDWSRLVSLDFETYYDDEYTLRKLTTSEYVRDPRFEALMVGIQIGNKPVKIVPGPQVAAELRKIPWETHSVLCHHAQFDGFILSHRYGIHPKKIYCSLSMARGLHSNDIGAGLDEVSQYYGGRGKLPGGTEDFKGLSFKELFKNKPKWKNASLYCGNDVLEMKRVFKEMLPKFPKDEIDLIHHVCRMFTTPVLKLDEARARKEYDREVAAKKALLMSFVPQAAHIKLEAKVLRALNPDDPDAEAIAKVKKLIGSDKFADLLRAEGVEPPIKISPAYFKHRDEERKYTYAFAKTDVAFLELRDEHPSPVVRGLVEARLTVKSSGIETRAGRMLKLGENGQSMPVYYKYAAAHTIRLGGGDKTNFQNLKRGGELRLSILAKKGEVLVVADSGQIEPRVNCWLWGQDDVLEDFRKSDAKLDRDVYCKFGDTVYHRRIEKEDKDERFVSKVAVLMLGYQAGANKFRNRLAIDEFTPMHLDLQTCQQVVNAYRRKHAKIKRGWDICSRIIEDMAAGRQGSHKCISWEKETIWLPDGMALKYPGLRCKRSEEGFDEWVYTRKGEEVKIYGGLLCENIVQALAKIIVMGQLLKVAEVYRVAMTTHDEIVAAVKKSLAEKCLAFMLKTMRTPPAWCPDIPLNADGGYAENYSK